MWMDIDFMILRQSVNDFDSSNNFSKDFTNSLNSTETGLYCRH